MDWFARRTRSFARADLLRVIVDRMYAVQRTRGDIEGHR
ncbi:hypothetical protein SSKA14_833 [Stenotrophomonas sp. SKA14]|nr:hypothetical protein SSKA14_833 [Stenotrophomonas sp. SKA14]